MRPDSTTLALFSRVVAALALVALLTLSPAVHAQVATQIGDLTPGIGNAGSAISRMERLGDRLVLVGGGGRGFTLYATDGTTLGTEPLGAECIDECSRLFNLELDPLPHFVRSQGRLFWWQPASEREGCQGIAQLWVTDATATGTRLLTDCSGSVLRFLTPFGGRLIFATRGNPNSSDGSDRLWSTDGTLAGTAPVPSADGTALTSILGITTFQGRLFVLGGDSIQGPGLWVSEGLGTGTRLLRALPGASGLDERSGLVATTTHVFFRSSFNATPQLWASDGTTTGTRPVSSFTDGSPFTRAFAKPIGNRLFFFANRTSSFDEELWQSDGTPAGTLALTRFRSSRPSGEFFDLYSPEWIFELGGAVLFLARDEPDEDTPLGLWRLGTSPTTHTRLVRFCAASSSTCLGWRPARLGNQLFLTQGVGPGDDVLWVTDGTPRGTRLAFDPCPNTECRVFAPLVAGGAVYTHLEALRQFVRQSELWRLNGSGSGAQRVALLGEGSFFSGQIGIGELGGRTLVPAWDERHGNEPRWLEPSGEPELLADLVRGSRGSSIEILGNAYDRVLFLQGVEQNSANFLWATDGRTLQALKADAGRPPCSSGLCRSLAEDGLLYFTQGGSFNEVNLWRSDGTPTGTLALTGFGGPFELLQRRIEALWGARGGRVYFSVAGLTPDGEFQRTLWSTDGTALGTVQERRFDALPDQGISSPADLGAFFYFVGNSSEDGRQVWRTDLTDAETLRLTDFESFFAVQDDLVFTRLGDRSVFFAQVNGLELWASDGSASGTARVARFPNDSRTPRSAHPGAQLGSRLYFWAHTASFDEGLWRTDGTAAGTSLVFTVPSDSQSFEPPPLVATTSALFFVGRDADHGAELWTSDGTPEGTRLVRDLRPGPPSSGISFLVADGSRVYFTFDDGIHGGELWVSDGTSAGTRLAHDLHPGPFGGLRDEVRRSFGGPLTVVNDRLYLLANDGLTGTELWSLPLAPSGPVCADAPNGLCLQGNRFRAEAAWRDFQGNSGVGTPVSLTADTGYFWFFDPANVELIAKQLDGRALNEHFWTFYGALSNVEYHLTLTDTETGLTRRFFNPPGLLASVADTESFGPRGAALERFSAPAPAEAAPASWAATSFAPKAASGTCTASASTLCLADGRFAVTASWRDFQGNRGAGQTRPISDDTGSFWFFGPENLEVVLKVLDGTPLNGKFWVFYGALSNVEYELVVTDTTTGLRKTYRNPAGRLASEADTSAF